MPSAPSFPKYLPNPSRRHSRSTCRTQTPSFPEYPPNPNAVIPGVPVEPKLRHSARSRGIHLCLPTHQPEKPVPSALQYGYCDFAQYDGVGRARASLSSGTLLPSFPKYPPNPNAVIPVVTAEPKRRHSRSTRRTQTPSFPKYPSNPNFVIPRAVAESIFACQRISQRSQPLCIHYGYCDFGAA